MTKNEYIKLKERKTDLIYCHCRTCIDDMPVGMSPLDWSRLEAIIDLTTGLMTLGCARCELPIVQTIVHPELLVTLGAEPCEACSEGRTKH
jgi:hypothetical protein